jgi:hypothetical protein
MKMLRVRITISILFCLTIFTTLGQSKRKNYKNINKDRPPIFYLYYGLAGLGSNLGKHQPTINVKGTNFVYTYEQNSFWGKKSKEIDTICIKAFRQSSIDSI